MRRLAALVGLLALALLGAWGWRVVAADPGYVLIALRGWSVETTLVVAIVAFLIGWLGLWLLLVLLRFPLRFWRKRRRHVARERLAGGLVALHEGRWRRAEQLLARAATESQHRLPALLGAARAAQARGDDAAAQAHLARAAEGHDPVTVALVTAREHQRRGESARIVALFDPQPVAALPPRALDIYLGALATTGRARDAVTLLPALRASQIAEGEALVRREAEILAAAMQQAPDAETLSQLWADVSRAQKTDARIVTAYARRAVALGEAEAGITVVEKALRKQWSPELAAVYGVLPRSARHSPLKMAEAWLAEHPDDPALLVTLGHLCRNEQIWGKAEDYLQRALASGAGADAWEELGHVQAGQHHDAKARDAYAKALAMRRGEAVAALPDRSLRELIAHEAVAETRSSMGVPLLPHAASDADYPLRD
ncbi:heme biosynthesis protein HemY [Xanthomonadaceae bacterium XH05]|nr:heme biosynthesis protein HemY [Xanthomonadaceae bacterium XH05]